MSNPNARVKNRCTGAVSWFCAILSLMMAGAKLFTTTFTASWWIVLAPMMFYVGFVLLVILLIIVFLAE